MNKVYVCMAAAFCICACSKEPKVPVLPVAENMTLPEAVEIDAQRLFGIWAADISSGNTNENYFEQSWQVELSSVEDGEVVLSHWFTDSASELRDSVVNVGYTYTFDGASVELTPKPAAAVEGAGVIKGVHVGNERMLLYTERADRIDTVCTLKRIGDPVPHITGVNRTMPRTGETVTVYGRNLQFIQHVYLPVADGYVEIEDYTPGSKELSFVLPEGDYAAGSIRCESADQYCYSSPYMFCSDCVFLETFDSKGTPAPYTGTDFEYTIANMGNLKSGSVNLSSADIPEGHSLYGRNVSCPEYFLSFFGESPLAWPVAEKTDPSEYVRFSSGDRFRHVLDNCNGLLTDRTPCSQAAIQMDIYVYTKYPEQEGRAEWSTGYLSYRLNKDYSGLTTSTSANVAMWEKDAPVSFEDGWQTFTIPLSEFSATSDGAMSTLGGLSESLVRSNLQTIIKIVNYPLSPLHEPRAAELFQFNMANVRLVPYWTPENERIN